MVNISENQLMSLGQSNHSTPFSAIWATRGRDTRTYVSIPLHFFLNFCLSIYVFNNIFET